ncbi:NAD-dependent epimerase/dehydratase family protein [Methylophilaceae bacterium Uisw_099_01]
MKIFITGATGFIGKSLLKNLNSKIEIAYALTRQNKYSTISNTKIKYLVGDLQNIDEFIKEIESVDFFIHCGAELDSKNNNLNLINIESSRKIIKILKRKSNIKFIFFSSSTVLKKTYKTEYSNSKKKIDKYILKNLSNYLIIRPTWVIGKESKSFINFLNHLQKYPVVPLIGSGKTKIAPIYLNDLVHYVAHLISNDCKGIYYASSKETVSYKEFISFTLKTLNLNKKTISLPIWFCMALSKYTSLLSKDALSDFLEEVHLPKNGLYTFNKLSLDYKQIIKKIINSKEK